MVKLSLPVWTKSEGVSGSGFAERYQSSLAGALFGIGCRPMSLMCTVEAAQVPAGDRVVWVDREHSAEGLRSVVDRSDRLVGSTKAIQRRKVALVLADDCRVDGDRLFWVGGLRGAAPLLR